MHDTVIALYHPVRDKMLFISILAFKLLRFGYLQFPVWVVHGLAPDGKMADLRAPKLISTFRGAYELASHCKREKVIHFDIGHIPCQIWLILPFFGMGHTWAGP